jgi:hypothetical protein
MAKALLSDELRAELADVQENCTPTARMLHERTAWLRRRGVAARIARIARVAR